MLSILTGHPCPTQFCAIIKLFKINADINNTVKSNDVVFNILSTQKNIKL